MKKLPIYLSTPQDLVSLPDVYLRVKQLIDAPCSDADDLANIIAHDPALSVRFLSIANSALFSPMSEITTVPRAITLLGTQLVHDIVLSASVGTLFEGIPRDLIDVSLFWRRCIERAVLAKSLADHLNVCDSAPLFVEGLLADIGHVILFQYEPERMAKILALVSVDDRSIHDLEIEHLGYDYCDIGGYLATQWELPDRIATVLEHHQEPAGATGFEVDTAIVHVAYRFVAMQSNRRLALDHTALTTIDSNVDQLLLILEAANELIDTTVATFSGSTKAT